MLFFILDLLVLSVAQWSWNFESFACNTIVTVETRLTFFHRHNIRREQKKNRYELILCSFTTKSFSVCTSLNYLAFSSSPGDEICVFKKNYIFCVYLFFFFCGCALRCYMSVVYECDLYLSCCLMVSTRLYLFIDKFPVCFMSKCFAP